MSFSNRRERVTYEWRGETVRKELHVTADDHAGKKLFCVGVRPDDDNTFLYRQGDLEIQFDATLIWRNVTERRWDVSLGTGLAELQGSVRATLSEARVASISRSIAEALLVFVPSAEGPAKRVQFDMRGWRDGL